MQGLRDGIVHKSFSTDSPLQPTTVHNSRIRFLIVLILYCTSTVVRKHYINVIPALVIVGKANTRRSTRPPRVRCTIPSQLIVGPGLSRFILFTCLDFILESGPAYAIRAFFVPTPLVQSHSAPATVPQALSPSRLNSHTRLQAIW